MPKQISPAQKIIRLEKENITLRQRVLRLEKKLSEQKAAYEKKLNAKKKIVMTEQQRQELIARHERAMRHAD